MMQATDFGDLHDPARLGKLNGSASRRIFVEQDGANQFSPAVDWTRRFAWVSRFAASDPLIENQRALPILWKRP
jgi:hypothetical protein